MEKVYLLMASINHLGGIDANGKTWYKDAEVKGITKDKRKADSWAKQEYVVGSEEEYEEYIPVFYFNEMYIT